MVPARLPAKDTRARAAITRAARRLLLPLLIVGPIGCTAFTAVRSAQVEPGRSLDVAVTVATPPGDAAAWFWTFDCAVGCDRTIPAVDVGFTHGHAPEGPGRPFEVGAGLSGFYPYAHGYVQLAEGPRPWGVGGRIGLSFSGWTEASLHLRRDVVLGGATRLLLTPTLFWHGGNSPNGMNPGTFVAIAQGVGLEHRLDGVSVAPSVLLVVGRVDRSSYGRATTENTAFAVLGLTARLGR